jgi:hypothetical protein
MRYTAIGYHGTDRTAAEAITAEGFRFDMPSKNTNMPWLGDGVYFWDNDANQAWRWITNGPPYARKDKPAVVKASLDLTDTLDLTTEQGRSVFERFVERFLDDKRREDRFLEHRKRRGHNDDAFFLDALNEMSDGRLKSVRAIVMRGAKGYARNVKHLRYPRQEADMARSRIVTNISVVLCIRSPDRILALEVQDAEP